MGGKLMFEIETKSPTDPFWEALNSPTLYPKMVPQTFRSVDVLEGDGKSAGTVLFLKYVQAEADAQGTPAITFSKDRVDEYDEEKKFLTYSIIDGEVMALYKSFKASMLVSPKVDGGSLVKWCGDYEKVSEDVPDPTPMKEYVVMTLEKIDAYVQKHHVI